MAKVISTAAALFLLFAFSHALTPSEFPNRLDDNIHIIDASSSLPNGLDNSNPVTDAEIKDNTLRLPSERSETVLESEPETIAEEPKLPEAEFATIVWNEENTADASKSETIPLTVISFRPVGRHFPRRPFPLGFRHGHRCRHGHRQGKWTPRVRGGSNLEKDTPYGDDMIISSGDELKVDRPFRGGARQFPSRWTNFRHVGPRFPYKHDDEMDSARPHRHHDHVFDLQNEGEEHHKEHRHEHEHKHEQYHGLFRSFRKFLNGF